MSFKAQITRARSISAGTVLKKVLSLPLRKYRIEKSRKNDFMNSTYSWLPDWLGQGDLFSYFSIPEESSLNEYSDIIKEVSRNIFEHNFNLLGSGWVRVFHGLHAKGLEDYCFEPEEHLYDRSAWLQQHITYPNLEESIRLSSNLSNDYVPIDWQIDFRSGYRWDDKTWYKDIKYGHIPGADIKLPWELGRFQHLPMLAYAAALSDKGLKGFEKSDTYVNEFINEIYDFVSSNPPRFGVQWISSMDVAIRAANWLVTYDLFKSINIVFPVEFENTFKRSIYEHAQHIINNLEWSSGMRGNHYLANIAGLSFIAAYMPVTDETTAWLAFSLQELNNELFNQFCDDGSNFEASVYYHFLSAEFIIYSTIMCLSLPDDKIKALEKYKTTSFKNKQRRLFEISKQNWKLTNNALEFQIDYISRFACIIDFMLNLKRGDGTLFQIGDNDGGKFLKLIPLYKNNVQGQQDSLAEEVDNRNDIIGLTLEPFEIKEKDTYKIINYLKTNSGSFSRFKYKLNELLSTKQNTKNLVKYQDFGVFLFRNDNYCSTVRCGSIGQRGKGGHAHNDQLSICLDVNSLQVLVDPGTYLYTPLPGKRNEFRATAKHNTLAIDGLEQNSWSNETKDDLFWLNGDKAKAKVVEIGEDRIICEHYGFSNVHRREIHFGNNKITGIDRCAAVGHKRILFHLHPFINNITINNGLVEIILNNGFIRISSRNNDIDIRDYKYSPSYGVIMPAKCIVIEMKNEEIIWEIDINI